MYGFPETTAYVIVLKIIAASLQKLGFFYKMLMKWLGRPFTPRCRQKYWDVVTNLFGQVIIGQINIGYTIKQAVPELGPELRSSVF